MNVKNLIRTLSIFTVMVSVSCVSASVQGNDAQKESQKTDPVDSILQKLNKRTQDLDSYQCRVEYRHVQPSVFDTQTLRKGILYYSKQGSKSELRVNFQTLQQDEETEQKYNEQYIVVDGSALPKEEGNLKGIWLVHLDYQFKSAKFIQIAQASEPNQAVNVFDLVSKNLPMVGFTRADQLKEQFDITLPKENTDSKDITQVHLKVKPNSVYKDDYVQIDCWINEKLNLPVKIVAISTEPTGEPLDQKDFYEIKFLNAKTNEKIDQKVFDFQIPKDFDKPEIYPLNEN